MSVVHKKVTDDMFEDDAQCFVNTVNCVGVMGKGVALEFRNRYPDNTAPYQIACSKEELEPGHILVTGPRYEMHPEWIVNLATKNHWRNPSEIEWVIEGVRRLREWAEANGIESIACPAPGAGNGQLDWSLVKAEVEKCFADSTVEIRLYPPRPQPTASARPYQRSRSSSTAQTNPSSKRLGFRKP